MAITYGKQGVWTNNVCPGFVDTPMIAPVVGAFDDPAVAAALSPLSRPAPEEIANPLLFFASDESSYCSGATPLVDGG